MNQQLTTTAVAVAATATAAEAAAVAEPNCTDQHIYAKVFSHKKPYAKAKKRKNSRAWTPNTQ